MSVDELGLHAQPDASSQPTFSVLGPLEVRADGESVHVGGPQIRTLLALLLLRPGQVMNLSVLVSSLWSGPEAPASAERTARTYMSRLRHALSAAAGSGQAQPLIVTKAPGYLLRADPISVDAAVFEQLASDGKRALRRQDAVTARSFLSSALLLWRGEAYGEFEDVPLLRTEASRLEELRLSTLEGRLAAELCLGLGPELVAELDSLVTAHPWREQLWVQLMTSLYQAGRQADALAAYQRARSHLADELGLEPSAELVKTHSRILAHDPDLMRPVSRSFELQSDARGWEPPPAGDPRPRVAIQLPSPDSAEVLELGPVRAEPNPAEPDPAQPGQAPGTGPDRPVLVPLVSVDWHRDPEAAASPDLSRPWASSLLYRIARYSATFSSWVGDQAESRAAVPPPRRSRRRSG